MQEITFDQGIAGVVWYIRDNTTKALHVTTFSMGDNGMDHNFDLERNCRYANTLAERYISELPLGSVYKHVKAY